MASCLLLHSQVDITVLDENDNDPEFEFSFFDLSVMENADPGTVLSPTVLATDIDEGSNAEIKYTLTGGPFEVDEDSGKQHIHRCIRSTHNICTCRHTHLSCYCKL